METPTPSLRDRLGALLRNHRAVILVEILLVLLAALRVRNAIFFLLPAGWLSLWLRRTGWRDIGLKRPADWRKTWLLGISLGVGYQAFSIGILVPVLYRITGEAPDLAQFASLRGNLSLLGVSLIVSWTLAAFGEEMVYRGYLLNRLADLFGRSAAGWGISLCLSALLFGLAHEYQGITGVLETTISACVMAGLYLAAKRNLWLPIIFHGVVDSIGFLLIYLGLYP
ncbi:MAG: CPBP family intramembrane glutamic endopeptidase [Chloroflexota bacterium]